MTPYAAEFSPCRRYRYVWRYDFQEAFGAAPLAVCTCVACMTDEDVEMRHG